MNGTLPDSGGWYGNTKTLQTGKKQKSRVALMTLAFLRESSPNVLCVALGQYICLIRSVFKNVLMALNRNGERAREIRTLKRDRSSTGA